MTKYEKLDYILSALAQNKVEQSWSDELNSGLEIAQLCQILEIETGGEENFYESILTHDGHIEYIRPEFKHIFRITDKGVTFIINGGYKKQQEDERKQRKRADLEIALLKSTLNVNRWAKISAIISIIALIVSIIAIIFGTQS